MDVLRSRSPHLHLQMILGERWVDYKLLPSQPSDRLGALLHAHFYDKGLMIPAPLFNDAPSLLPQAYKLAINAKGEEHWRNTFLLPFFEAANIKLRSNGGTLSPLQQQLFAGHSPLRSLIDKMFTFDPQKRSALVLNGELSDLVAQVAASLRTPSPSTKSPARMASVVRRIASDASDPSTPNRAREKRRARMRYAALAVMASK